MNSNLLKNVKEYEELKSAGGTLLGNLRHELKDWLIDYRKRVWKESQMNEDWMQRRVFIRTFSFTEGSVYVFLQAEYPYEMDDDFEMIIIPQKYFSKSGLKRFNDMMEEKVNEADSSV